MSQEITAARPGEHVTLDAVMSSRGVTRGNSRDVLAASVPVPDVTLKRHLGAMLEIGKRLMQQRNIQVPRIELAAPHAGSDSGDNDRPPHSLSPPHSLPHPHPLSHLHTPSPIRNLSPPVCPQRPSREELSRLTQAGSHASHLQLQQQISASRGGGLIVDPVGLIKAQKKAAQAQALAGQPQQVSVRTGACLR